MSELSNKPFTEIRSTEIQVTASKSSSDQKSNDSGVRQIFPHKINVENIIFTCISCACIAIGVLHALGYIEHIHDRVPPITLTLLGLLGAYLVVERRGSINRFQSEISSLIYESNRTRASIEKLETKIERISSLFESISADRFSELKLLYGLRSYQSAVSENEIIASRDHIFSLWTDTLGESSSFLAFNYVGADEVWGTAGWAFKVAHALQVSRIGAGCTIKRIFVIDGPEEFAAIREIMKLQRESGIQTKWIYKSVLDSNSLVTSFIADIGSWDFVIVDNELVFRVFLDTDRHMTSCSLRRDQKMNRKAHHIFTEAFHIASD